MLFEDDVFNCCNYYDTLQKRYRLFPLVLNLFCEVKRQLLLTQILPSGFAQHSYIYMIYAVKIGAGLYYDPHFIMFTITWVYCDVCIHAVQRQKAVFAYLWSMPKQILPFTFEGQYGCIYYKANLALTITFLHQIPVRVMES